MTWNGPTSVSTFLTQYDACIHPYDPWIHEYNACAPTSYFDSVNCTATQVCLLAWYMSSNTLPTLTWGQNLATCVSQIRCSISCMTSQLPASYIVSLNGFNNKTPILTADLQPERSFGVISGLINGLIDCWDGLMHILFDGLMDWWMDWSVFLYFTQYHKSCETYICWVLVYSTTRVVKHLPTYRVYSTTRVVKHLPTEYTVLCTKMCISFFLIFFKF